MPDIPREDVKTLVHELETYQIELELELELELQNEDLSDGQKGVTFFMSIKKDFSSC